MGTNPARLWGITSAGYAAVIFAASSVPGAQVPGAVSAVPDVVLHVAAFAGFGAVLTLFFRSLRRARWPGAYAFVAGAVYGVSDEVHQLFVVGREASAVDAVADVVGVLVGVAILAVAARRGIHGDSGGDM